MRGQSDFTARLKYKSTIEGGRSTPAKSGYFPLVKFAFTGHLIGGLQTFIDTDIVNPGGTVDAEIELLIPEAFISL